ncbi:MAG: Ethyl tert-butyl ether degradation EthD, partial [Geminicoccaceae bacterium]|nr:Ethyl tert-butyl ether degradation EthD [Geminicoccaceae bacterium]
PAADSTAEAPESAARPAAIVTVLYNAPKDAAAFEKYYAEKHLPLVVASQDEIGFKRADLTKFESALDGKKPAFYRQAELYFDSMDDLQKGVATPGFKKVADDLNNFASGGLIGMVATTTNEHETGGAEPGAIVTVIYKAPKDTAAFEKYYSQTHLPLVVQGQPEIGFTRAELTRFNANLDGSMR